MRRLKWFCFLLISIVALVLPASASDSEDELKEGLSVDHLQIRSFIRINGDLQVHQVYKLENYGASEFRTAIAKPVDESKVSQISVRGADISFRENYDWDSDIGIDDKANTYAVKEHDDYYEIVIAITDEGQSNISLFYTIDDAIKYYDGFEGMYVNFVDKNMEVTPESVSIMIERSNEIISEENSDVIVSIATTRSYFEDGVISIKDDNYVPGRSIGVLGKFDNIVGQEKDANQSFNKLIEDAFQMGDGLKSIVVLR